MVVVAVITLGVAMKAEDVVELAPARGRLALDVFLLANGGAHQLSRRPIGRTAQRRQPAEIGAVARTSSAPRPETAGQVAGRPGPPLADPLAYQARPITMGPLRRAS